MSHNFEIQYQPFTMSKNKSKQLFSLCVNILNCRHNDYAVHLFRMCENKFKLSHRARNNSITHLHVSIALEFSGIGKQIGIHAHAYDVHESNFRLSIIFLFLSEFSCNQLNKNEINCFVLI